MTEHSSPAKLAAYFDGAVADGDADAVEAHLGSCPECRAHLAAMAGARRAVQLLPVANASDRMWARVNGRLQPSRQSIPPAPPRPPRRRGAQVRPREAPPTIPNKRSNRKRLLSAVVFAAIAAIPFASPLGGHLAAAVQLGGTGINYGLYLDGLTDKRAMDRFAHTYGRRRIPIGSRGTQADRLLESSELANQGLSVEAAYTLSDGSARAAQVTYRSDRWLVDVFRQPAEHQIRLDGYRPRPLVVDQISCLVVDAGRHRAITFTDADSRYFVVTRHDDTDVSDLVTAIVR